MTQAIPSKLGNGEWPAPQSVRYPNVYKTDLISGRPRLTVGPANQHVETLLSLAEIWGGHCYLLYVLLVPRRGEREPGRYQSPGPLSFEETARFCQRFAPFLQGDGRHHLWIGSTVNAGLLVYDQHEWIYAYGDVPGYIRVLQTKGFREGEINPPVPHSHSYNSIFDDDENELIAYWPWIHFPLEPGDEY